MSTITKKLLRTEQWIAVKETAHAFWKAVVQFQEMEARCTQAHDAPPRREAILADFVEDNCSVTFFVVAPHLREADGITVGFKPQFQKGESHDHHHPKVD